MGRNVDNPVFVRARIDEETRDKFKIACMFHKSSMDAVLTELIEEWVAKKYPFVKPSPSVEEAVCEN